jgi:hypothetical protein
MSGTLHAPSSRGARAPALARVDYQPLVVVFGSGRAVDLIHLATATLAISSRVLRSDQLLSTQTDVPAVVLCGSPKRIRQWHHHLPESTITVGALRRHVSRTVARLFDVGLNEVVTCEMGTVEIAARIRAALKPLFRPSMAGHTRPTSGPRRSHIRLYDYFRRHPRRIIGQQELIDQVFGGAHSLDTSLARVHVAALRKALGPRGHEIQTIRGLGYCYLPRDEAAGTTPSASDCGTVDQASFFHLERALSNRTT